MPHFIIYKPDGYLSQFVNNGPKKNSKKLLGQLFDFPEGSMAVGRLDEQSEGLLMITTDGKVSERIRSHHYEKEYYAQVDGLITIDAIEALKQGVEIQIDGKAYITKSCSAQQIDQPKLPPRNKKIRGDHHGPTSWLSITLTEGKFRQVRKMTAVVGFPTLRLVRVRIGDYTIENMKPGEVQEILINS